jgi:hypothetical protein
MIKKNLLTDLSVGVNEQLSHMTPRLASTFTDYSHVPYVVADPSIEHQTSPRVFVETLRVNGTFQTASYVPVSRYEIVSS